MSQRYAIVAIETGRVLSMLTSHDADTVAMNTPDGAEAVACADRQVTPVDWQWVGGSFHPIEPTLDDRRFGKWDEVKTARDQAVCGGCASPLGRVDTDAASQLQISGAVQLAQIAGAASESFSIDWTMADNSVVTHDGPAMIAMGVAVGEHVAACYAVGRIKREAIEAAADVASIDAVDIASSWPA